MKPYLSYATKTNGIQNEVIPLLVLNDAMDYLPPIYHPEHNATAPQVSDIESKEEANNEVVEEIKIQLNQKSPKEAKLLVYPNPSQQTLYLEYQLDDEAEVSKIEIVDMKGAVVKTIKVTSSGSQAINVSAYRNGTYIARLYLSNSSLVTKTFSVAR